MIRGRKEGRKKVQKQLDQGWKYKSRSLVSLLSFLLFSVSQETSNGFRFSSPVFTREEIRGENVLNDATPRLFLTGNEREKRPFLTQHHITSLVCSPGRETDSSSLSNEESKERRQRNSTVYIDCIVTHVWVCESNPIFQRHWLSHQLLLREMWSLSQGPTGNSVTKDTDASSVSSFPVLLVVKRRSRLLSCFRSILFVCHPYLLVVFTASRGDWMQTHLLSSEKKSHSLPKLL